MNGIVEVPSTEKGGGEENLSPKQGRALRLRVGGFTDTSGPSLAEQARRLMHPDPVKKEELTAGLEDRVQKRNRLAE